MPDELKEHLILRELDDNRSWMQELFKQLVGWYTFFATANIAVMSWLVTRKDGEPLGVVPWLMMLLNICAVVMVALSWRYLMAADSRSRVLITRLNRLAQLEEAEGLRSVFPRKIMSVGLLFLVIGLLALTVAWKMLAR